MAEIFYFWKKPIIVIEALLNDDSKRTSRKIDLILIMIMLEYLLTKPKVYIKSVDNNELLTILFLLLTLPFVFLFIKFIITYLIWAVGRIFEGKATTGQIRVIFTYSLTPFLIFLPFKLFWFIVSTFNIQIQDIHSDQSLFRLFSILSFSYLIIGLRKVNYYSSGYALATVIIVNLIMESFQLTFK